MMMLRFPRTPTRSSFHFRSPGLFLLRRRRLVVLILSLSLREHLSFGSVSIVVLRIILFELVLNLSFAAITRRKVIMFPPAQLFLVVPRLASLVLPRLLKVLLSPKVYLHPFWKVLFYFMTIVYEFFSIRVLHIPSYRRSSLMIYPWMFLVWLLL